MKKFEYSMENVLNIKYKLEDQAKTNYSVIRFQLNKEEEALYKLRIKKNHYEKRLQQLVSGSLDFKNIKIYKKSLDDVKNKILEQKELIKTIEAELEIARIELEKSMIERKTQENLKDKAFDEYKQEYNTWESKEVDELNSFNYSNPI
ncbi:MAG TPA: flagellar export protein FliJ [Clostridiales bacterium]|nr:flagellar export protein FliJ [Clostridiales bacterium]